MSVSLETNINVPIIDILLQIFLDYCKSIQRRYLSSTVYLTRCGRVHFAFGTPLCGLSSLPLICILVYSLTGRSCQRMSLPPACSLAEVSPTDSHQGSFSISDP